MGMFLVFLLADWIYRLGGLTRLIMLCVAGAVLLVLLARHCLWPLVRRISDERIALLIEERSAEAAGAVISAVEFEHDRGDALHNFLVDFLLDDAVRRIDHTPARAVSNLPRLRKHAIAAGVLLAVFAVTTLTAPGVLLPQAERVFAPWVSIEQERLAAEQRARAGGAGELEDYLPIEFELIPGDVRRRRGETVKVLARLSRQPAEAPHLFYRVRGADEPWKAKTEPMREIQGVHDFALSLEDINEDLEYQARIVATGQASRVCSIEVYDPLVVQRIEATCHYPEYLQIEPETRVGGDISAPVGSAVELAVQANNTLVGGTIDFEAGPSQPLKIDPARPNTARFRLPVAKDTSYKLALRDRDKQVFRSSQFYYVKAVPDRPPTVEMTSPKVDMSIHPLCEVTFAAAVTDDFGVRDATVHATLFRGEKQTALTFPMKLSADPPGAPHIRNGKAEHVYEAETGRPRMQVGDMIFYHLAVTDRKGQAARTDVFYVKMWPLEVAATWPNSINPPDLPHETFDDPMDLMLFLAAAWHLEQQRGKIPEADFNTKSEQIAKRMEVGDPPDFSMFWEHGGAPAGGGPNRGRILAAATRQIEIAHGLLKNDHQPGKAVNHMRAALAMVETLAGDKRRLQLALDPEPLHTGQPSSGHADDPIMEQVEFRAPSVKSDSLTAYQQPDNPPRLLPPDYRRALKIKQRQAVRTRQLEEAGQIYASAEQLVKMAAEQLGHIQLREAIDDNTPPDPAVPRGGGEEIRVDKRPIPFKDMVAAADRRADVPEADRANLSRPNVERVGGLPSDPIPDNRREGGSNPHMTQTPGSGGGGQQEPSDQLRNPNVTRRPLGGAPADPGQAGEQTAGGRLAGRQMGLARRTEALARGVARSMQPGEVMAERAVGDLRAAADEMKRAAASFQGGDLRRGIARARRGQQALRAAMHRLRASQYDSLEAAIAAAQDGAAALAANQRRVSAGTRELARRVGELSGKARPAAGGTGDGSDEDERESPSIAETAQAARQDPRLGPRMKGLAREQGHLAKGLGEFARYVGDLRKWTEQAAKKRVTESLGNVTDDLRRHDTGQKMIDAAVGLAGGDLKTAREAQRKIDRELTNVVAGLGEAAELLAGSPTGILRRAARAAKQIGERTAELSGREGTDPSERPGGQPSGDRPSTRPAGEGGRTLTRHLAGRTAAGRPGPGGRPPDGAAGAARGGEVTELWLKTRRLAGTLRKEGLVDARTLQYVDRRSADIRSFREMFERANREEAGKFSDMMLGVGSTLETALEEVLSAERLNAEQREECPPQYRSLVNAYFEALSKAVRGDR
jgi:hypothetical protein